MRFGLIVMPRWSDERSGWLKQISAAAEYGFDFIGVADSQSVSLDTWMTLVDVARTVDTPLLGPCVTNTYTRHPAVTASAAATLHTIAPGRVTLPIGRGASATDNLGRSAAGVEHTRDYITALRSLLDGTPATFEGCSLHSGWVPPGIPMYLSVSGPKMLRLAGAACDGLFFNGGVEPERIDAAMQIARQGAEANGRDPDKLECWLVLRSMVRDSEEQALDDLKPLLSATFHNLRLDDPTIPESVLPLLADMAKGYDAHEHITAGQNVQLMDDLGLTPYLAGRYGVYGTPAQVASQLDDLDAVGVTRVVVPNIGAEDPTSMLHRYGTEVLPLCRSAHPRQPRQGTTPSTTSQEA